MVGALLSLLSLLGAQMLWQDTAQAARVSAEPAAQDLSITRRCEQVAGAKVEIVDRKAFERLVKTWLDTCRQAIANDPNNSRLRLGIARALSADGQMQESIHHLRFAAARDDMDALFELFHIHITHERGELLVPHAAAEYALRQAAELGHPEAMLQLAVAFDRGGIVERNPVAARFWVEELIRRTPEDQPPAHLLAMLGRLLAQSEDSQHRAHGLRILEDLAKNRGDAQKERAIALRAETPVRARTILD